MILGNTQRTFASYREKWRFIAVNKRVRNVTHRNKSASEI